jgi:hypothetical protein
MIACAARRAVSLGRRYLRLDCDPKRTGLRAFYERNGFRLHSEARTGRFLSARYEIDLTDDSNSGNGWARAEQLAKQQGLDVA